MARAPIAHDIDEVPQADRLEGFAHPRTTTMLFGHAGAEEMLAEQVREGKLHQGLIVSGREGIGKATLAYRLARHLLAEPAERDPLGVNLDIGPQTRSARQVAALSHPGLLVLRRPWDAKAKRFATAITVEEVRRLRAFLGMAADEGSWRVVIVDQADDLNVNAANALLKSLEEPPARTVFVLLSCEVGRLLPTVRSRCRMLMLEPLGGIDLRRAVETACGAAGIEPPAADEWPRVVELAGGSVRRALTLAGSGAIDLDARIGALLAALPRVDWPKVHALADELAAASAEQRYETFFDLLLAALARLVHGAATGAATPSGRPASTVVTPARLPQFAEAWSQIVADRQVCADLNLDKRALIVGVIGRLAAVARR